MQNCNRTILVTGAAGKIGSFTVRKLLDSGYRVIGVDVKDSSETDNNYKHFTLDISDRTALKKVIEQELVDRVIHLAALAHSRDGRTYSWNDYYQLNVECSKSVFDAANNIPVLFISTVDVYGFTDGVVTTQTEVHPVSHYAKSKVMAENECKKLAKYTIFRFSPVYTSNEKLDIQKRYYLKYPSIAYQIGNGMEYEILNIDVAISAMRDWCEEEIRNDIRIIKDPQPTNTADLIKSEKVEGRAKFVLKLPYWVVNCGYIVLKKLTGENKYTYLLNKAVNPLKTK